MSDCISNENYDGYVARTVDPGASMLIGTILVCAILLASLPCLLSITKRWKRRRAFFAYKSENRKQGSTDDVKKSETSTLDPNALVGTTKPKEDDENSVSSIHSKVSVRTGVSGTASAILNLILDSAPHGGPNPRKNHLLLVQRDQMLETQAQFERSPVGEEMEATSADGNGSVLGKLDHDAVSVQDAVDASNALNDTAGKSSERKPHCFSRTYWARTFNKLLIIAEFDYESKRICKLGTPFIIQGLIGGIAEAVSVALIGRLLGTNALSAYIVSY
jgi:hypothetical protein